MFMILWIRYISSLIVKYHLSWSMLYCSYWLPQYLWNNAYWQWWQPKFHTWKLVALIHIEVLIIWFLKLAITAPRISMSAAGKHTLKAYHSSSEKISLVILNVMLQNMFLNNINLHKMLNYKMCSSSRRMHFISWQKKFCEVVI